MNKIKVLANIAMFVLSMVLVFKGQSIRNGYLGILLLFLGVGILLTQLYLYNRKYQ